MGSGRGKTKGGAADGMSLSSKIPTITSRQDLDSAVKDAAAANQGVGKQNQLIVLEFTASWCSVCRKISPFYDKLLDDPKINANNNVTLYQVDVDESPDLTNFYGASALPLFVFLVDGKKVDTIVGAQQTALKKKILKHASSKK